MTPALSALVRKARRALIVFMVCGFAVFAASEAIAHDARPMTKVSFDLFRGKIVFTVRSEGRDLLAIYDTGAQSSVLSVVASQELGLDLTGAAQVGGFGGGAPMRLAQNVVIDIGGTSHTFAQLPVIDLSAATATFGRRVDLVLGRDAFRDQIVTIDFTRNRLSWTDPARFSAPHGMSPQPLRQRGAVFAIDAVMDGRPVEAGLDLGAREAITVGSEAAQSMGLQDSDAPTMWAYGVGGAFEQQMTSLRAASVAGGVLHDVPVAVLPGRIPAAVDVIFGLPIWSRYTLVLDFAGEQAWLAPVSNRMSAHFQRDFSGLTLTRPASDRLRIEHIGRSSPAEVASLRVGDEIVSINGGAIARLSSDADFHAWAAHEGHRVVLTLSSGDTRVLELRRYY